MDTREAVARLAAVVDNAVRRRRVSGNQVALYAGISNGYLSRIRRGMLSSPPSPQILQQLAPALQVPYETLLEAAGYLTGVNNVPSDMGIFFRAREELTDEEFAELVRFAQWRLREKQADDDNNK